jgi:hypothetical protein
MLTIESMFSDNLVSADNMMLSDNMLSIDSILPHNMMLSANMLNVIRYNVIIWCYQLLNYVIR